MAAKKGGTGKREDSVMMNMGVSFASDIVSASPEFKKLAESFGADLSAAQSSAIKRSSTKHVKELQTFIKKMDTQYAQALVIEDKKAQKLALNAVAKEFKTRWNNEERFLGHREQAAKDAEETLKKNFAARTEEFGNGLQDAFSQATSGDIGGFANLFKKFGGGLEKKGMGLKDSTSKTEKGLGEILARLGPLAIGLGAVVAGFAAIAGVIIQADSQAKEFNKSILDGVSIGDLGVKQAYQTAEALEEVRKASLNLTEFGTLAQDNIAILNAYAKAGLTFREIRGELDSSSAAMMRYTSAMKTALVYSKLFGEDVTSVATSSAEYVEDLGLTIGGVEDRFATLYKKALQSGFGVQRFYSMVLQATSGMAMYNVRIEEAAGLLLKIGKVLGSKMGGEYLQSLTKGFMDESMTDRIKRIMITGPEKFAGYFVRDADAMATDFLEKLGDKLGEDSGLAKNVEAALQAAGIDVAGIKRSGTGKDSLLSGLKAMKKTDRDLMLSAIRSQGGSGEALARQLGKLIQLTDGTKGGMENMAQNIGALGMGSVLAAKMEHGQAIIGKSIQDMTRLDRIAFENITGISGEAFEQLKQIAASSAGDWVQLQKLAKAGESQTDLFEKFGVIAEKQADGTFKYFKAQDDGAGNLTKNGLELKNSMDLMSANEQKYGDEMKQIVDEQTLLARTVAENTTGIMQFLQQRVQQALEGIYDAVQSILGFLGLGADEDEKKLRDQASQDVKNQIAGLRKQQDAANVTESELMKKISESSGDEKKFYETQLSDLKEGNKFRQMSQELLGQQLLALNSLQEGGFDTVAGARGKALESPAAQAAIKAIAERYGLSDKLLEEATRRGELGGSSFEKKYRMEKWSDFDTDTYRSYNVKTPEGRAADMARGVADTMSNWTGQNASPVMTLSPEDQAKALEEQTGFVEEATYDAKDNSPQGLKRKAWAVKQQKALLDIINPKEMAKAWGENEDRREAGKIALAAGLQGDEFKEAVEGLMAGKLTPALDFALDRSVRIGGKQMSLREASAEKLLDRGISPDGMPMSVPGVEDFMLRLGSDRVEAMRINRGDQLFGAKPNGPISQAGNSGGPGKGTGGTVNITINGNEEKAYAVVRRALQTVGIV